MKDIMQQSDRDLFNLLTKVHAQATELGLNPQSTAQNSRLLSHYLSLIIRARYLTEGTLKAILEQIIDFNLTEGELMASIQINTAKAGINPEIAAYIHYYLSLFIKTALRAKQLTLKELQPELRHLLAKELNCGPYAAQIEKLLPSKLDSPHDAELAAARIIQEYRQSKQFPPSNTSTDY